MIVDIDLQPKLGDNVVVAPANRRLASMTKLQVGGLQRIDQRVAWVVYPFSKTQDPLRRIDLGKYRILVVVGRYTRANS